MRHVVVLELDELVVVWHDLGWIIVVKGRSWRHLGVELREGKLDDLRGFSWLVRVHD